MASCWTNKSAILRDLSKAQGRYVPGGVEQTVGANEKPPALDFIEETEEEFFNNCTAGGDFIATPDLGLIKEMLNMVKDVDLSSGDDDDSVEITKLNPNAAEFKPRSNTTSNGDTKSAKLKRKLNRNVALTSLLTSIANNSDDIENTPINNSKELKLLKPDDFTESASIKEGSLKGIKGPKQPVPNIEPVIIKENSPKKDKKGPSLSPVLMFKKKSNLNADLLDVKENSPKNGKNNPNLSPVIMFKKKPNLNADPDDVKENSPNKGKKGPSLSPILMFKKRSVSTASVDEKVSLSPSNQNKEYKPSVLADQYYKKYLEKAELAAKRKEDIWTRAERLMKELEAKRATNATSKKTTRVIDAVSVTDADSAPDATNVTDSSATDIASDTNAASVTDTASVTGADSVTDGASVTDPNVADTSNEFLDGSGLSSEEASSN